MDESATMRLDLRSPLLYAESPGLAPIAYAENTPGNPALGEQLFCFEINPEQSRSIEPDREQFLGAMVFAGSGPDCQGATVTLPAGIYLFAQKREALGREDCIDLAIEQQKDGLWERHQPQALLYVRYLFEDGKPVTQLFRPI